MFALFADQQLSVRLSSANNFDVNGNVYLLASQINDDMHRTMEMIAIPSNLHSVALQVP